MYKFADKSGSFEKFQELKSEFATTTYDGQTEYRWCDDSRCVVETILDILQQLYKTLTHSHCITTQPVASCDR